MNTYKVKIKSLDKTKTHIMGELVVMAETPAIAVELCHQAIPSSDITDFCEPKLCLSGVIIIPTKSAWDGYH